MEMSLSLGCGELEHDSHVPFLSHLVGTHRILTQWGAGAELCDAGLFHSVYGTEYFDATTGATRPQIRDVIGAGAEAEDYRRDLVLAARGRGSRPQPCAAFERRSRAARHRSASSTVITTLPTFWPVSTYSYASTI